MNRKIIHIDMDAFFAAVEQRDFPELRGQPVVVGGKPDSRGVVATCSYEARKFGIHSAMPASRAYQLCPHARFVPPRFPAYKQASEDIHKVFHQYTDIIEPLSLDEAYLDVTESDICNGSATLMARDIRANIHKTIQLTASAGIAYNKFLAKLASDQNKPDGQYLIKPGEAELYLKTLPIGRFYGVGKVTEAKMQASGIQTGGDLKNKSLSELQSLFGNSAEYYYNISRGIDDRPVMSTRIRKSLGSETTFQSDISDTKEMLDHLLLLLDEVLKSMEKRELLAYTITIKVKYASFRQVTRSYTSDAVISVHDKARELIPVLLAKTEVNKKSVRLLGLSFSNLISYEDHTDSGQLPLF
ncbi:MAG: DNA polymerase IV [endosymbiont of Galathealinum brachiosum]|uniref:DNA polymerase IV n=1 Tax=endosymbiont of Galathealinum brachiosum TaxID=2200906 RepID=A0A370DF73_9GAMM|nr:MAG: DNA polymerase IV [endosymbiont of Galathealinum brachiosum]